MVAVHPYLITSFYKHEFIILYGVGPCTYRQVHIYPMDVFKQGPGRGRSVGTEHSGTEVVLVREGPRAGGGSSQRKKGSDYFTSHVKTMTLRDIK